MKGKETKHVKAFRQSKMRDGEEILSYLEGWIGKIMGSGSDAQKNGTLIVTNERVIFYRKGLLGEVFQTIPVAKLTSVETKTVMGYKSIVFHTSHDDLTFKSFEPAEFFDQTYREIDGLR